MRDRMSTVVHLAGDLDLAKEHSVEERLERAITAGTPVLVDVGDCTFADVRTTRLVADASRRAHALGVPFVVMVPYSAPAIVRRLFLELAAGLAELTIAPTLKRAQALVARRQVSGPPVDGARLSDLRARMWENASRAEELIAQRDDLLIQTRRALQVVAARKSGSG